MVQSSSGLRNWRRADRIGVADARLLDRMAALVAALGHDGFDAALGDVIDGAARVQQFVLFAVPRAGNACCLHSWHRDTLRRVVPLAARYVDGGFHRVDPALRSLPCTAARPLQALLLDTAQIDDADYRRDFFEVADLGSKLSVFDGAAAEGLYLNFYRRSADADFSDREVANLCAIARLLCASVQRHRALAAGPWPPAETSAAVRPAPVSAGAVSVGAVSVGAVRAILDRRAPVLTAREKDVCARVVLGFSSEAIALDLGVAESSVRTYRKRAYAKLGFSSQHELFALCLSGSA